MHVLVTRLSRGLLAALIVAAALAGLLAAGAEARPHRGATPWSVILCKFSDRPAEPRAPSFFRDLLTQDGAGRGGTADYWRDMSGGAINLSGSVVRGWYTMPVSFAQAQAKSRGERISDCVKAAQNDRTNPYRVPAGHRAAAMINERMDSGAVGSSILLDPSAWTVSFAAHEMGHGLELDHSHSPFGEYDDPWDVMSNMNGFVRPSERFVIGGPGLNAHHVDRMGWMPRNRILTFGQDGALTKRIRIAALHRPSAQGPRLVRVPFDPGDLQHYYTVELRLKEGWDAGIPAHTVLIHEIKRHGNGYRTFVLRQTISREPVQVLADRANDVAITLHSIDPASGTADVTITAGVARGCVMGFVWREAGPADKVCVTGAARAQVRADNAAAASRRVPGVANSCKFGWVWREAFPGDTVCVTGAVRKQTWADNAAAPGRSNPSRLVTGPNTCASGYVWREIDWIDYVCVTPSTRNQVRLDNSAVSSRRIPGVRGSCKFGWVWREAFPGDDICVHGSVRSQTWTDNAQAGRRLLKP